MWVLLAALPGYIQAQSFRPDDVLGVWETANKKGQVKIYNEEKQEYRGNLVWILDSLDKNGIPVKDLLNPDPYKRTVPIKGLVFMERFGFEAPNKWVKGKIYGAESGNTYSAQMTLVDINTLELGGYIGMPLLGRSERWRRIR